jgi:hypothetical protein
LSTAGDVNSDGYSDIVSSGTVFFGSPSLNFGGMGQNISSGTTFGPAGDVNGDGFGDVASGDYTYSTSTGAVRVHYGFAGTSVIRTDPTNPLESGAWVGTSVASAGDVDGDGFDEIAAGAPGVGPDDRGRAYLWFGSSNPLPLGVASCQKTGSTPNGRFGQSVAGGGDVNGDGYADVLIAEPGYSNGSSREGAVHLMYGNPYAKNVDCELIQPSWTFEPNQAGVGDKLVMAGAGDVNGDGFGDVIIGAPTVDTGPSGGQAAGRASLFLGSPMGLRSNPAWSWQGSQADMRFGASVASAGDVNGDGLSDVVIGATGSSATSDGQPGEGRAYLFLGSATSGLHPQPAWTAEGNQVGAEFGNAVSGGDLNGDGLSDLIVGAHLFDDGAFHEEGRSYVFLACPVRTQFGCAERVASTPSWQAGRWGQHQNSAQVGISVSAVGDMNGDGRSEFLVGAYRSDSAFSDEGRADLYSGASSINGAISPGYVWGMTGDQTGADAGYSVAAAGDINGDGYADAVIGVPGYNTNPAQYARTGSVAVLLGGAEALSQIVIRPRTLLGRQTQPGSPVPVQPLGRSSSTTSFGLSALGRSAAGRSRVRLEWRSVPLNSSLATAPVTYASPFFDSGSVAAGPPTLASIVSGLQQGWPYIWQLRVASSSALHPYSRWVSKCSPRPVLSA